MSAEEHEDRSAEEPADLRDEVGDHHPHRGERSERHLQDQPQSEDVDAREDGDEERSGEVLREHLVEGAADPVGLWSVARGHEAPHARDEELAVEQHDEGDHRHGEERGCATDERTGEVRDRVCVDVCG